MAFPREKSLAEDVAWLVREVRKLTRARSLGNSSLSPGQGYMDILDAAGNPVARVGEGAIWTPNGVGGWAKQDDINQINRTFRNDIGPRVSTAETGITSLGSRATALESWRTTASGQISTLETANVNTNSRIDLVWQVSDNTRSRLTSVETKTSSLEQRQGTAEQQIVSLTQRVSNLEAAVYGN